MHRSEDIYEKDNNLLVACHLSKKFFKKISFKIGYYWTLCGCQLIAYRTSVAVYRLQMNEDLTLIDEKHPFEKKKVHRICYFPGNRKLIFILSHLCIAIQSESN